MRRTGGSAGAVTTEVALALPAVALVLAGAITVVGVLSARASTADAARAAARAAARGDADDVVRAVAHAAHAPVRSVGIARGADGLVTVVVVSRPPSWTDRLPVPDVTASAVAHDETVAP